MGSGDGERVVADQITDSAEDLGLGRVVAGNLAVVLGVASESKEHDTLDLGLDVGGESLNGVVHDRSTLTVGESDISDSGFGRF